MTLQEVIDEYNLMVQSNKEELDPETMETLMPMIISLIKSNTEEEIPELEFINNLGQIKIKS